MIGGPQARPADAAPGRVGLLLHADPAFAAGAASFSSGLETLVADGWVTSRDDLRTMLDEALHHRWNTFDRVFLCRAHRVAPDLDGLAGVDADLESRLLGQAARAASRRAGGALLGVWARLGDTGAGVFRDRRPDAHLPVAQGLVARVHGLGLADAEALAGWSMLSAYAGGAVRLGVVGHRAAQLVLREAAAALAALLSVPVAPGAEPHAWTPAHDVALERHPRAELRLFAS